MNIKIPHRVEVMGLTGEYQHTLDAKGRLFMPAKLRERLGNEFFVTISMDKCLSVYSAESWKSFSGRVDAMSYVQQRKMRPLFVYASRVELDNQGRILLPQNLRNFAGLVKNVTIVGCNNHVELWDSEAWRKIAEAEITPENIAAVMEELMI
ncbi:MAG: division/cell wall cluster transcriptional repressor MraZ [Oscillospiraceae bacterium]